MDSQELKGAAYGPLARNARGCDQRTVGLRAQATAEPRRAHGRSLAGGKGGAGLKPSQSFRGT